MKSTETQKCIFEKVYVETPVDTDGDGLKDLIACYITRPDAEGPVPAVMVANPYLMFCNEDWYDLHPVDGEIKAYPGQHLAEPDVVRAAGCKTFGEYIDKCASGYGARSREVKGQAESASIDELPEFECITGLYGHLNRRGYASVFCGGLGTRGSDGFTLSGRPEEIAAFRAVIDWLNGRARAFTDKDSGMEVRADWCTGKVAMSGRSYLGTLCFGVAATGVEGLEAIIPEAGISSWYDYYRHGGLCVPALDWQGDDSDLLSRYCMSRAKDPEDFAKVEKAYREALNRMIAEEDRDSGNYNDFWDARNYVKHASEFKASVFIIQGINDWNVKTDQASDMFRALQGAGKDCRMMLHQGEHISIYDLKDSGCLDMVDAWLDHYLKGTYDGPRNSPRVLVESNLDQSFWYSGDTWPPEGAEIMEFPISRDSDGSVTITDDLELTDYDRKTDDRKAWRDGLILGGSAAKAENEGAASDEEPYCLRFYAGPYDRDLRIAGPIKVKFRASIDREATALSAMLVDLGDMKRLTTEQVLTNEDPENPEEFIFGTETEPSAYKIISRGWINSQNRNSVWSKEEITPEEFYDYRINMVETDHTLPKGHRLGLILYGTDADFTLRPEKAARITFDKASIKAVFTGI